MRHHAGSDFWKLFAQLHQEIRDLAKRNFELFEKRSPASVPPLKEGWAVVVGTSGLYYRALGKAVDGGILWGWIGSHEDYDKLIG